MGTSIPTASRTPRPIRYCSGSYPNTPRCPGPLPGVMPGATGSASPNIAWAASASRFGVCAASSSVFPSNARGSPPTPSITSRTIFVCAGRAKAFKSSRDIIQTSRQALRCVMRTGRDHINMGGNRPALRATVCRHVLDANPDEANLHSSRTRPAPQQRRHPTPLEKRCPAAPTHFFRIGRNGKTCCDGGTHLRRVYAKRALPAPRRLTDWGGSRSGRNTLAGCPARSHGACHPFFYKPARGVLMQHGCH